jgi:poly(A) polymerase
MRLQSLSKAEELTPRAKYRFFHELGKEGIDLILLALSNALASERVDLYSFLSSDQLADNLIRMKELGGELLRYYHGEFMRANRKPLLDGKEVMEALGISPGKAVGSLLKRLREEEMAGRVQTREEALKFLKNIDRSG